MQTSGFRSNGVFNGKAWRTARRLNLIDAWVATHYPKVYCLGTGGDQRHVDEGTATDHGYWMFDPSGIIVVRAEDLGGPISDLTAIRNTLAASKDPVFQQYGFLSGPDNLTTPWPYSAALHGGGSDAGHLHISVTQVNGYSAINHNAGYAGHTGYMAIIDNTTIPFMDMGDDDVTPDQVEDAVRKVLEQEFFNGAGKGVDGTIFSRVKQAVNESIAPLGAQFNQVNSQLAQTNARIAAIEGKVK